MKITIDLDGDILEQIQTAADMQGVGLEAITLSAIAKAFEQRKPSPREIVASAFLRAKAMEWAVQTARPDDRSWDVERAADAFEQYLVRGV